VAAADAREFLIRQTGENAMTLLIKTLAAAVAGTVLATSAFAQSPAEGRGPAPFAATIENEPAPKVFVEAPLPDQLARGVAIIPYRVENFRILPVVGAEALKVSPRVGHLHVTLDDLPWHWADFGNNNAIVVAPLPAGPHKLLIELADAQHRVLAAQSVTFAVPSTASHAH
jgi:hypothetical protein